MTFEEVEVLARAIHDDIKPGSCDNKFVMEGFSHMQKRVSMFPANEVEEARLWNMALKMWYLGRAYERLYAYENNLVE